MNIKPIGIEMQSLTQTPRTITVSDTQVRQRIQRLADMQRRGPSQMARLLLADQLDAVEKKLGLAPLADVVKSGGK